METVHVGLHPRRPQPRRPTFPLWFMSAYNCQHMVYVGLQPRRPTIPFRFMSAYNHVGPQFLLGSCRPTTTSAYRSYYVHVSLPLIII